MPNLSSLAENDFKKILEINNNNNFVLFISDVLESSVGKVQNTDFITYICKMIELFKSKNFLIVITEYGSSLGSTIQDILSLVLNYDNLIRVSKDSPLAFNLIEKSLKNHNVNSIMVVGIEACYCCLMNSRIFINKNYKVFVSLNGIVDSNREFRNMNKTKIDKFELSPTTIADS